jgi:Holliday junction DNA helicase RuvA
VPGVGAKTAKLIVVTLSGKLKALESERSAESNELLVAMQSLGWPERVAEPAVREVLKNRADKSLADLVRETLRILGSKS